MCGHTLKENRAQRLISTLNLYGGKATLGTLLNAMRDDGGLVYKFTASVSEAREVLAREGKTIFCHKGPAPSENEYSIEPVLELFTRRVA